MMATRLGPETVARIEAAWLDLIETVASGGLIGAGIRAKGLTPDQVRVYRTTNPQAAKEWEEARIQSADAFADEIQATIDNRELDSQFARVRVDSLKWLASKRNPRIYSDKAIIDMNVRAVDLTQIIRDAQLRLAQARAGRLVNGESERVLDDAPALGLELANIL
jgi:hypothetical protein